MPRQPKPWFRDGRGWYVQLHGRQVFLGEHPSNLPRPSRGDDGDWLPPLPILDAFYARMAGRGTPAVRPAPANCQLVVAVLDAFLDWLGNRVREGTKAQRTYDWYHAYLRHGKHAAEIAAIA